MMMFLELYEGLKRAQRCRLEDQRGTEINFELPDFLKDKENAPQAGKKLRKLLHRVDETTSKFYDHLPHSSNSKGSRESLSALNESFLDDGVIPPHRQAEEYFFSRSTPPGFGPSRDKVAPFTTTEDESKRGSDPPPLPPKPKHLPVWGRTPAEITNNARFLRPADVKRDTRVCRNRRAVYLDEPSSSFV
uniref:Uncharacterized protein n=1 Tax=Timema tahoe TaxID=61484 RepID=A0A7R9NZC9_9NEOP|nr:unnamed protein product [Timema tahoe]